MKTIGIAAFITIVLVGVAIAWIACAPTPDSDPTVTHKPSYAALSEAPNGFVTIPTLSTMSDDELRAEIDIYFIKMTRHSYLSQATYFANLIQVYQNELIIRGGK